ncbi:MAG: hypothetical protein QXO55_07065 [Candidatus Korarchaeum sp.]
MVTSDELLRLVSKRNPLAVEALSVGIFLRDDFHVKNSLREL